MQIVEHAFAEAYFTAPGAPALQKVHLTILALRDAGLHQTDFGQQSLEFLAESFKTHEHTGSVGWITESGFEGSERAREAREAAGIVQEFIRLAQDTV
ncbi:hypothetical protein CCAX7_35540 [Capsulimonas corticalis]|uniref:Uncharacterized protein n=1 Tax=Capsulimonas corticalis TaxID=2219043 RepID=A0A402D647_9BACT|nr:hypothetical protein [Capsulimonas corticalis]BDI31503.1 hypothetical protein CCAX7_35540 [Capsulimonas corticalis]